MTNTAGSVVIEKRPRLKFIDMARSIAILLMLEGHFIHDSLDPMYIDHSNPFYATWYFIRGFTAPVFLTVTGLIFVYLMLMDRDKPFRENQRVRKGVWRAVELIFWGYVLQPGAFHVLQCIGYGMLTIMFLFGIYKAIKRIPLWMYYLATGLFLFYVGIALNSLPKGAPWPENAPDFIQNMFHGDSSRALFPIVPWMGYTMVGAAIGCWLHDFGKHVKSWAFALTFVGFGVICFFFVKNFLGVLDNSITGIFGEISYKFIKMDWVFEKMGMVFIELGVLMVVEKLLGEVRPNLFLKLGQNTLSLYIVHMIVLYGAITGLGLNRLFHETLNPIEAVLGAISFIILFVVFTRYIDPLRAIYNKVLNTILPWRRIKSTTPPTP